LTEVANFTRSNGEAIAGRNDREFSMRTLEGCKKACSMEKAFTCLSFDYVDGKTCKLSKSKRGGSGVSMVKSSTYQYFERQMPQAP
jgi:hypothetical protein